MKLYFFGSDECETCQLMLAIFDTVGILENNHIEFIFVDAFSDDQQYICDEHEVDEIPHIKLFDDEDEILFDRIGVFNPAVIKEILLSFHEEEEMEAEVIDEVEDKLEEYYDIRHFRSNKEE